MQDTEIKTLVPVTCPHCSESMYVELITSSPRFIDAYTPQSLEDTKEDAVQRIKLIGLPEALLKETLEWIQNPETIFAPSDISEILKNVTNAKTTWHEDDTSKTK